MSDAPSRPDSDTPPQAPSGDAAPARPIDPARAQRVAVAARHWQRHLADLGGPNTLLWYEDLPSGTLDLTTAHPGGVSMLMAGRATRLSDLVREPSAFVEARRRAHVIRDKVHELEDERGLVTGFMAIGMATWDVPGARRPPRAPVLLRSCALRPTDPAHRDYDLDLDPRVHLNPVLVDYLALEQGVRVDPDAITDIAYIAKRFDPMPAFREVSRLCRAVPGFRVADRRVVGTFSYAKSPMVADLRALGDGLAANDLVAALAGETGAVSPPAAGPTGPAIPAAGADPGDGLACFDTDGDQQGVVDAVRGGANALVRGAPGTGRTQTIAALAAGLAADGKRVLVVGQKRATLTSLADRLAEAGLDSLLLDLHEGALDRGRVARLMVESLEPPSRIGEPDLHDLEASLAAYRDRLDRHRDAMHEARRPWGVSVAHAHDALARLGAGRRPPVSRVRVTGDTLTRLDLATRDRARALLVDAAAEGAWTEELDHDPWARSRVESQSEAVRAEQLTRDLAQSRLGRDAGRLDALLASVGMPPAPTPARWGVALDVIEGVRDTLGVFTPDIFGTRLNDYVGATASRAYRQEHGVRLAWWTRWSLRNELKTLVRPDAAPGRLHDHVAAAAEQQAAWERLSEGGSTPRVPEGLSEARACYDALAADLTWLGGRLATTRGGGDLKHLPLDQLGARLDDLASRADRLDVVPRVIAALDALDELGLTPLVDDLAARRVPVEQTQAEVEFVWWCSVLDAVAEVDPRIGKHDGAQLRTVLEEYARLDGEYVRAGADRVRTRVRTRLREIVQLHPRAVDTVRAEAARRSRHLPVRELVAQAGPLLTAARPVWTMSPLVVASVLPPGEHFDVLVVEDASQVEPAQLVSAAARSRQIVLVGDEAQLPPRPFRTAAADAEQAELDDVVPTDTPASALDALRDALPAHRLRSEYRSRDERVVALAARHLYDGLDTFPGTLAGRPVSLVTVTGDHEPDADGADDAPVDLERAEVAEVVRLVLAHADTRPRESLGVLTLSAGHAHRLTAALRAALDGNRSLATAEFFDDSGPDAFFVKPLERAQGDVRDAVILSVGHGRTGDGRVAQRLGPVNLEGGERRLGVACTSARSRMTVVSSLVPADLDPGRLASRGARLLRDILTFAGGDVAVLGPDGADGPACTPDAATTGALGAPADRTPAAGAPVSATADGSDQAGGAPADDAVLARFAARLREEGLVVHERYGLSGRRIDLAVEDPYTPGRVVVAVESDGPVYAGQSRTRDRDRLRAAHLRELGWEHVRVWGLDVAGDPASEVARVLDAVRAAEGRGARPRRRSGAGSSSVEEPGRW